MSSSICYIRKKTELRQSEVHLGLILRPDSFSMRMHLEVKGLIEWRKVHSPLKPWWLVFEIFMVPGEKLFQAISTFLLPKCFEPLVEALLVNKKIGACSMPQYRQSSAWQQSVLYVATTTCSGCPSFFRITLHLQLQS